MLSAQKSSSTPNASMRQRPSLTVDTTRSPPSPKGLSKIAKQSSSRSESSLVTASTSTTPRTKSPSVTSNLSLSRCSSPPSAITSDRSSWLGSPKSVAVSPRSVLSPPVTTELYFRLLKKSDMLDQLLTMNCHLESQLQLVRELESDRARNDSVQEFVFHELESYKRKFVESQQYMLEVLEAMTFLAVQEEELRRGTGTEEAKKKAFHSKEERVMRDLGAVVNGMQTEGSTKEGTDHCSRSIESSALRRVGLQRVDQLSEICQAYETQLKKSEVELSKAMHTAYRDDCLSKIKRYEAIQLQHDDEIKSLQTRIENLQNQTNELQDVIDDQRDELAQLRELNHAQQQRYATQCSALEQFGRELKTALRKRYGVVPNVVDSRWHEFFPHCTAPE